MGISEGHDRPLLRKGVKKKNEWKVTSGAQRSARSILRRPGCILYHFVNTNRRRAKETLRSYKGVLFIFETRINQREG